MLTAAALRIHLAAMIDSDRLCYMARIAGAKNRGGEETFIAENRAKIDALRAIAVGIADEVSRHHLRPSRHDFMRACGFEYVGGNQGDGRWEPFESAA